MKSPDCPKCGSLRTSRRERAGFFQKTVMFHLGRFPWECNSCWTRFYDSERGHRARPGDRRSKTPVAIESSGR